MVDLHRHFEFDCTSDHVAGMVRFDLALRASGASGALPLSKLEEMIHPNRRWQYATDYHDLAVNRYWEDCGASHKDQFVGFGEGKYPHFEVFQPWVGSIFPASVSVTSNHLEADVEGFSPSVSSLHAAIAWFIGGDTQWRQFAIGAVLANGCTSADGISLERIDRALSVTDRYATSVVADRRQKRPARHWAQTID